MGFLADTNNVGDRANRNKYVKSRQIGKFDLCADDTFILLAAIPAAYDLEG